MLRFSSAQLICLSKRLSQSEFPHFISALRLCLFSFCMGKGRQCSRLAVYPRRASHRRLDGGCVLYGNRLHHQPHHKGRSNNLCRAYGLLTAVFRILGSSAEGVSYAIVISNLAVPLIEKSLCRSPSACVRKKRCKHG